MKTLLAAFLFSAAIGFSQCGALAINPITGLLDCSGTTGAGTTFTNIHSGATTPTNTVETCVKIVSTILTDFQQSATSAQVRLFTAPALWSPRSFRVEETTTLTSSGSLGGGASSAVAACIGTVASPCGYSTAFPLLAASTPVFRENSGGATLAATATATQDVYLQLAVTNVNPGYLSNLTGGVVTVRICGVTLQ